jgi:hypothetical protein
MTHIPIRVFFHYVGVRRVHPVPSHLWECTPRCWRRQGNPYPHGQPYDLQMVYTHINRVHDRIHDVYCRARFYMMWHCHQLQKEGECPGY